MKLSIFLRGITLLAVLGLNFGCSLYSNTDRENFNSRATVQGPAAAGCRLETEGPSPTDSRNEAIVVRCGSTPNDKTIVRVSR